MNKLLDRLRVRWRSLRDFSQTGYGWRDRLALARAGVARRRPFSDDSLYARIGRVFGHTLSARLKPTRGGRIHLDLRDLTDLMIFEEIFIEGIYPFEGARFTPDTILDCGACAGHFSLLAASRQPRVNLHLFEPDTENLVRLRRNIALNSLNATIHPCAVGVHSGKAFFQGHGFGGHIAAVSETGGVEVAVISLPDFITRIAPKRLWLKIDVEGSEQTLLPAIAPLLPRQTVIWLETHHAEPTWRTYISPLLQNGFQHTIIRQRTDEVLRIDYVEHLLVRD